MVPRTLVWSDQCKADLAIIFDFYFHRNGNSDYSRKLYAAMQERMQLVLETRVRVNGGEKVVFGLLSLNRFSCFIG